MKEVLYLKKVSEGCYAEDDNGLKYVQELNINSMMKSILDENKRLHTRLAKKNAMIHELKKGGAK